MEQQHCTTNLKYLHSPEQSDGNRFCHHIIAGFSYSLKMVLTLNKSIDICSEQKENVALH